MIEQDKNDAFARTLMLFPNSTKINLFVEKLRYLANFVTPQCVGRPQHRRAKKNCNKRPMGN